MTPPRPPRGAEPPAGGFALGIGSPASTTYDRSRRGTLAIVTATAKCSSAPMPWRRQLTQRITIWTGDWAVSPGPAPPSNDSAETRSSYRDPGNRPVRALIGKGGYGTSC
jgi:hypothetical protein